MNTGRNISHLIDLYLLGALTQEQRAELLRLIEETPEIANDLTAQIDIHNLLAEIAEGRDFEAETIGRVMKEAFAGQPAKQTATPPRRIVVPHSIAEKHTLAQLHENRGPWYAGWLLPLAAAAGIVLALGVFMGRRQAVSAQLTVADASGGDLPAVGQVLAAGARISTGPDETIKLSYEDGTMVQLLADTEIVIASEVSRIAWKHRAAKRLKLARGHMEADVAAQPAGMPLVVESVYGRATVVGTRLSISESADKSRLEVTEGMVEFMRKSDRSSVLVPAGYCAEADGGFGRFAAVRMSTEHETIPAPPAPETAPVNAQTESGKPRVVSFALIDAERDEVIPAFDPIPNGAIIDMAKLDARRLNILIRTEPEEITRVTYMPDFPGSRIRGISKRGEADQYRKLKKRSYDENIYPYSLNDWQGDFANWLPADGRCTLTATPEGGEPATLSFTIINAPKNELE